ncbi:MAG: ketopantoate reductase family protein, partial [Trebonia sp.]
VGEIAAVHGGEETARAIVAETHSIAAAAGYPVPERARDQTLSTLTKPGSPFTSSQYRDLSEGRPAEVETILGDLVAEGRKAGLDTPLLDAATVALRVYDASLSAG